jgi:hypothetical protein
VHDVGTDAACDQRDVLLLAAHPLDAVARPHRHEAHRHERAPGRARLGRRLAVDERDELEPLERGEARQQLARDGLHAAGLARHEEDEVQRDADRLHARRT